MSKGIAKPKDVDAYIASVDGEARAILLELRALFRSAVPGAEERIAYGVPFYRYHGDLGGFAVYTKHVSVGFGAAALAAEERDALTAKGYVTGKRTIQVAFGQKVPAAAIRKILKAQARLNEAG